MSNVIQRPVRRTAIALSTFSLLAAGCASVPASPTATHDHPSGGMQTPPEMNMAPTPFSEAEMSMHRAMMMATDVNTQRTWARKMIAHHRGAIAMSQALLASDATDVEIRRMAQAVIDAQTREVTELESWLARHPG